MATLVLTAVGGLVGGPIGAALGGLAGQAIDRGVIFRPRGRQGPRLTELAVQTSSYGTPIPAIFGRMRVAGSVIWATDLIETRSIEGGGKAPRTTQYSYAASFAVALSARPIADVGRIWADGKLLRGAAGDWKSRTGFRLHRGGEDQLPDPLIASAEGAALAPAHRGIAYAVFELLELADFGNRIPSLTFEVIADAAPVAIGDVAAAVGGGVVTGAGPRAPLIGFSAHGDSARAVLETLAEAGGARFSPEGARVRMLPPDAPATEIEVEEAPAAWRLAPAEAAPRALTVHHYDPARDYQAGVQEAVRPGAGGRGERVEMPAVLEAAGAKALAAALLARRDTERTRRTVRVGPDGVAIAPGGRVRVAGEAGSWRVVEVTLDGPGATLTLAAATRAPVAAPATSGRGVPAPDRVAGRTLLHAAELPPLDETPATAPRVLVLAAGEGPGWRRASLLHSLDDGASWRSAGSTGAAAAVGALAVPLAAAPATLIDARGGAEVLLAHEDMALESAAAAALDVGANLAVIGGELVQFAGAQQLAPRRWRLERLRRGVRGTPIAAHPAGTPFALAEPGAGALLPLPGAAAGATVRLLASGIGDADAPAEAAVTLTGVSVAPPAPVHLAFATLPGGGGTLTWVRRSRLGFEWRDGADVPLGEERERYEVMVTDAAGVARSAACDAAALAIAPAWVAARPATLVVRQAGTLALSAAATLVLG